MNWKWDEYIKGERKYLLHSMKASIPFIGGHADMKFCFATDRFCYRLNLSVTYLGLCFKSRSQRPLSRRVTEIWSLPQQSGALWWYGHNCWVAGMIFGCYGAGRCGLEESVSNERRDGTKETEKKMNEMAAW
jgi:hypothetical protein